MSPLLSASAVLLAATIAGWPGRAGRSRLRRLVPGSGARSWPQRLPTWRRTWSGRPLGRGTVLVGAGLGALAGGLLLGPVGGLTCAGYAALGSRAVVRRQATRTAAAARIRALDELAEIAADLRAGLPVPELGNSSTVDSVITLWRRADGAVSLAGATGAPLADLLERIEADGRAADRAAAGTAAQSAGARATAWLLGALPVVGVGLGYAIGADPLHVLLRTPVGLACAVTAMALQVAGVAWVTRLSRPPGSGGSHRPVTAPAAASGGPARGAAVAP
jgi:tight adherence protein B